MSANPYDREDTCQCNAWNEGECGCGGYVDLGQVRAWQEGYDAATARALKAEQECRDRECTEQDVRARLADAENSLAKAKVEALREAAAELRANVAAWRARGAAASTPTADWLDARAAALDGAS